MTKRTRAYVSPARERQASETRERIAAAARRLFLALGFDATTMAAIAEEAGVATPTVYAAFRSKRGIVAELVQQARFGAGYRELVKQALAETDLPARLRFTAGIARQVYDGERSEMDLLRGAGLVAPELGDATEERARYTVQKRLVDSIAEAGRLPPELSADRARDVLHTMTSRDVYRRLVVERGWASSVYERWLGDTLVALLLAP